MATVGLYGSSTSGVVAAATGSESSGLYGNNTNFGGTYFEWFIFKTSATQPATPTGGSWNFTTNSNTPPTGWTSTPPSVPTNKVWVSIAVVNSRNTDPLVWSAPGLFSYSSGLPILSGTGAPSSGIGQADQLYIQTDITPQSIWFNQAGTWTRLTGSALYVDLTSNQTIAGTKTFSSVAITGGTESGVTHSGDTIGTYLNYTGVSAPAYLEGRTWYDSSKHALAYYNDSANSVVHIGQDILLKVINNTGSTIANGSPVYITSTSSGQTYPNIALARADVASTASVIGLTNGAITNGSIGYVTAQGGIDGVNTGTFTVGQVLYLSPYSAGQLMNTIPPTGITVQVGVVSYVDSSAGKIYVKQTTPLSVPASIITGTLPIANGGTGATTAAGALTALGAYPASNPSGYTNNTGTVTSVAATAGTGISVSGSPITSSGTLTITNTAPDQTVSIASGTGISVTGTYPSFTITNTGGSSGGTVTSVSGTGTVNGLTLTGTVTTSGSLTLGGTLDLSSPPAIGGTAPAAGTFTTLTGNSTSQFGRSSVNYIQAVGAATTVAPTLSVQSSTDTNTDFTVKALGTGSVLLGSGNGTAIAAADSGATIAWWQFTGTTTGTGNLISRVGGGGTNTTLISVAKGTGSIQFATNNTATNLQFQVSNTASAVNYVQVTGAATTGYSTISAQGSDASTGFYLQAKGTSGSIRFSTNGANSNEQFRISNTASAVNYLNATGSATTFEPVFSVAGADTDISMVFQPKGTGAIDLAAGSSGVNISNGGTVTAITRTAAGVGNYTSVVSVAISAPTTAGGVQATATVSMGNGPATITSGGTGYTVGDILTMVGGTLATGFPTAGTYTVATVSGGVVTSVTTTNFSQYTVLPTNPVSTTGGTGTGCTLNILYNAGSVFNITNAGSGYVEQPTVSFSGGGGSGAAAYATVGTNSVVTSLGGALRLANAGGLGFQVGNAGTATVNYLSAQGSSAGNAVLLSAAGSDSNIAVRFSSLGTSSVSVFTNNSGQEQLRVAHTASAVNYVQVTGAATGGLLVVSAQGSDANIPLAINAKGTSSVRLGANNTDYLAVNTATAGTGFLQALGGSANIDIQLLPKGTGKVVAATGIRTRVLASTANSATPTLNVDNYDMMVITGQSVAITSFTTNLSGTPTDGQKLWIAITGTGSIGITWGASFESSTVTLPTTTVTTTRLDVGFVWNVATSKWRCVATA